MLRGINFNVVYQPDSAKEGSHSNNNWLVSDFLYRGELPSIHDLHEQSLTKSK